MAQEESDGMICPACGEEAAELLECPHCGGEKCAACDMGDDVACVACDGD